MLARSFNRRTSWGFWAGWATAFLGFPISGLAGLGLAGAVTGIPQALIGGATTGAVLGLAQWLVLRRHAPLTPWWVGITAAGMAIGLAGGVGLFGIDTTSNALVLRGLVTGAGIGMAQYLALKGFSRRAPIWPLVVTFGWAAGWLVTRAIGVDLTPNFTVFGAAGALTFQLVSGLALAWILGSRQ